MRIHRQQGLTSLSMLKSMLDCEAVGGNVEFAVRLHDACHCDDDQILLVGEASRPHSMKRQAK